MKTIKPPKFSGGSLGKSSSKSDPIATALYLAEQRSKLPQTGGSPYAEITGNVATQLQENLGGQRGGWRSVVGGFLQGVKNSADLSKMFANQKKAEEFSKTLDYFQEVNNARLKQQQHYEKLENAQRELRPEAIAYFQNTNKDPQTAHLSGLEMWNKYKNISGATGEFIGWMPLNQNVAMIRDEGRIKQIDIRPLLLGEEYTANEIAALGQNYQNQLQDQRQENDRKYDLETRKVRSLEGVNNKRSELYDAQIGKINSTENPIETAFNEVEEIPLQDFDAVARRGFVTDARNEITASKESQGALRILDELEELSEAIPNISNLWTRNAPFGALTSEQQAAIKKYEKYQSQIAQPIMRSRGSNLHEIERKVILAGIPNWDQPLEARRDNIRTKKRELQTLVARGIYAGNALARKVTPSQVGYEKFLAENPNLVPEGVNPTFVQTSDFRNELDQGKIDRNESSMGNNEIPDLSQLSDEELINILKK